MFNGSHSSGFWIAGHGRAAMMISILGSYYFYHSQDWDSPVRLRKLSLQINGLQFGTLIA